MQSFTNPQKELGKWERQGRGRGREGLRTRERRHVAHTGQQRERQADPAEDVVREPLGRELRRARRHRFLREHKGGGGLIQSPTQVQTRGLRVGPTLGRGLDAYARYLT